MQVRIKTGVDVSTFKEIASSQAYTGLWRKAVALATPGHRERCPKCGSRDFLRSHRKNLVEFALSAFVLPYRCSHCYYRFFRSHQDTISSPPVKYRNQYPSLQHARRT